MAQLLLLAAFLASTGADAKDSAADARAASTAERRGVAQAEDRILAALPSGLEDGHMALVDPGKAADALKKLLADPGNGAIRDVVLQTAARLGLELRGAEHQLVPLFDQGIGPFALLVLDSDKVMEHADAIRPLLKSPVFEDRLTAALRLAAAGDKPGEEALHAILRDPRAQLIWFNWLAYRRGQDALDPIIARTFLRSRTGREGLARAQAALQEGRGKLIRQLAESALADVRTPEDASNIFKLCKAQSIPADVLNAFAKRFGSYDRPDRERLAAMICAYAGDRRGFLRMLEVCKGDSHLLCDVLGRQLYGLTHADWPKWWQETGSKLPAEELLRNALMVPADGQTARTALAAALKELADGSEPKRPVQRTVFVAPQLMSQDFSVPGWTVRTATRAESLLSQPGRDQSSTFLGTDVRVRRDGGLACVHLGGGHPLKPCAWTVWLKRGQRDQAGAAGWELVEIQFEPGK